MNPESLLVCDTNVCVFRTLATINPKVFDPLPHKILKFINDCTNNKLNCKIVITDTVKSELVNVAGSKTFIVPRVINEFCSDRLHLPTYHPERQRLLRQTEKSLLSFVDRYHVTVIIKGFTCNHAKHISAIDAMYLTQPAKLKNITQRKIQGLPPHIQANKLRDRPNDLPEQNDRHILAESIELFSIVNPKEVVLCSHDSDFTEFATEIQTTFKLIVQDVNTIP